MSCYFIFWKKVANSLNSSHFTISTAKHSVSVIIPFRNEEHRIKKLLQSIKSIDFEGHIEFIFIDDHSTDLSVLQIQSEMENLTHQFYIQHLPENKFGKKNAINLGVAKANNNIIITTDADCEFLPTTFSILVSTFIHKNANLGLGPVFFHSNNCNAIETYQKIENTALVALGFYQLQSRKPTMANGANLIFLKSIFEQLNPFENNQHIAGGDDIFTLEAFYKLDPQQVIAINHPEAGIVTSVLPSFKELWLQRVRWVKKTQFQSTQNTQKSQQVLAIFFMLFWGVSMMSLYLSIDGLFLFLWCSKILVDTINLQQIFKLFNQKITFIEILVASVFQNFFIPILGILHPFFQTRWKERNFN